MNPVWKHLLVLAEAEIQRTLKELPTHLRVEAERVPVVYEPVPKPEMLVEGEEADLLGLFIGEAFADRGASAEPLPAQILLFLENIWDLAEGDEAVYGEEVRITYLHELGHYLGLEEEDLEERGLD